MTVVLTQRQRQVVELLVAGHPVTEIALALHCTESTVRKHIEQIAGKFPGPHPPMRRLLVYGPALLAEAS